MAYRNDWVRLIRSLAPKYGVDPQAVLAVASREGLSGGVGDGGHAFGPFQLNDAGGVITNRPGNHRQFAESQQGIDWALGQIGQVAKGLHGRQAVEAIVRRFERPADPNSEVSGALSALGQFGGGGIPPAGGPAPAPPGQQAPPAPGIPMQQFRPGPQLLASLNASLASGAPQAPSAEVALPTFVGRTLAPPKPSSRAVPKQDHHVVEDPTPPSGLGGHIVQFAASQIGQPYVWGGESRKEGGFDCSGLVDYALRSAGVQLPGRLTTYSALHVGQSVKGQPLKPGDMMIVNGGKHMVLYAGNGRVIAAPHTGAKVQYQPVSDFTGRVVDVRRV